MTTPVINPDLTYDRMTYALLNNRRETARALAGQLRDHIVDGGAIPARTHAGDVLLAALAPDCPVCEQSMIMAGGVWTCGH